MSGFKANFRSKSSRFRDTGESFLLVLVHVCILQIIMNCNYPLKYKTYNLG